MKKTLYSVVAGCCAVLLGALSVFAQDVKLTPGVPAEFEVPHAPPSMAIQLRHSTDKVRMTIKVPANYDSRKTYPVLVFLNGGDGGMGGELNMAEPFLGGNEYILCNMPLFKRVLETDRDEVKWSLTPADAPYAMEAFHLLFKQLQRLVPNIDTTKSVLAGFSNGANMVGVIVWSGDVSIISQFSRFVMVEGGFWLGSDVDSESGVRFKSATFAELKDKRVVVMYGDQTTPEDRIPWIKAAQQTVTALKNAGVDAVELPMKGIGHDFTEEAMVSARRALDLGL